MHFDDHEVIVVQLAGRKRWTIAQNTTVVNPLHNAGRALEGEAGRYADGPPPPDLRRGKAVALRPGSVLFLPRGYWHQTIAQERSISLTFGFRTPSWLDLLQQHLASTLSLRPEWRQTAWGVWDDSTKRLGADERWEALRATLVTGLAGLSLDEVVPPTPKAQAQVRRRSTSTRPRR
jgi:50S ribosomal protein L16 3-hydroxylase